jgi:peroxiredoxin
MPKLQNGDLFPDLELSILDRGRTNLSELSDGSWTLVHTYRGEWCPMCQAYFDRVAQARADIEEAGLRIVAISADPEEKARATRAKHDLWFPIAYGASIALGDELGIYVDHTRGYLQPAFFLLDPARRIQHISVQSGGAARPAIEEFVALVSAYARRRAA